MPAFIVISAGSNLKPLIFILTSPGCDAAGWVEGALTGGTLAGSAWVGDEFRDWVGFETELQAARSNVESNSMVINLVFILIFSIQMNIHVNIKR